MGVLIRVMEMPTSCDGCWALDDYGDYPRCRITNEQRGYNFPVREQRMGKCPLIHVPPHGRLIDADALYREMFVGLNGQVYPNHDVDNWPHTMNFKDIKHFILSANTIIPADA